MFKNLCGNNNIVHGIQKREWLGKVYTIVYLYFPKYWRYLQHTPHGQRQEADQHMILNAAGELMEHRTKIQVRLYG